MRQKLRERGSATAELVVALPILITLALTGVKFVGESIQRERLHFLAEGIVQAVMRDESNAAIARELTKALPGARFTIIEASGNSMNSGGEFTVTVRYQSASATARGYL